MLFGSCRQVLLFAVIDAILDSRMSVHDNASTTMNKTSIWYIWYQNLRVLDGWCTLLRHIFRPYISVHFVIYSSAILHFRWRLTSRNYAISIFRSCPWKYESSRWKYLLLEIGRFRIGHSTFRLFPKCTSGFYATILTFPVEMWKNFITAINSPRSSWQSVKNAWPYFLQFWRQKWSGGILPSVAEIRVNLSNIVVDGEISTKIFINSQMFRLSCRMGWEGIWNCSMNKKAVLPQGNRAMPQVFFSVKVRQQHSLQV